MTHHSTDDSTDEVAPTITVVVCTCNRPAALDRCLRQLRQLNYPDFSIVVVDSAPTSPEAKLVVSRYDAQYILSPLKGLSRARNIGTRASRGDIIVYLDDDMVPHARWLEAIIGEFADKNVMAVTGPVLALEFANGSDIDLLLAVEIGSLGQHAFQVDKSSRQWFERTNFGGIGDGNFALRRAAFDKIRGFDERLGRGA